MATGGILALGASGLEVSTLRDLLRRLGYVPPIEELRKRWLVRAHRGRPWPIARSIRAAPTTELASTVPDASAHEITGLLDESSAHCLVRGELIIYCSLPENHEQGLFAKPRSDRAWVRFSGRSAYQNGQPSIGERRWL